MGGTRLKICLVKNNKLIAKTIVGAKSNLTLEKRLTEIESDIDTLLSKTQSIPIGIGISFPGIVDSEKMKILSKYNKYTDAQKINLKEWAFNKWKIPLALENDARAALVGEWKYGAGIGNKSLVLVTLGTGVGSAVLINGKLLKGKNFIGGNLFGHSTINYNGSTCNCGNIGCLEAEASSWSLSEKVKNSSEINNSLLGKENEINFETLFVLASKGDLLAIKIRDRCIDAWATAVINMIHAYDPEKIVIGGGIMKSKDVIIPKIEKKVFGSAWIKKNSVEIIAAQQVDYAAILGMNHLVKELN